MCHPTPSPLSIKQCSIERRSLLRGVAAGTGVSIAGSIAAAAPTEGLTPGTPVTPLLPRPPAQPQGTVLTLLGTAGAPQAENVRAGTSTVLIEGGQPNPEG